MKKSLFFVLIFSLIVFSGCTRKATAPGVDRSGEEAGLSDESGVPGKIRGKLSYPSEVIPEDMTICAQEVESLKNFCTNDRVMNGEEPTDEYELEVPIGTYEVYAFLPANPDTKAFYSEFVTCGLLATCPSHAPIEVVVKSGETVNEVNPGDWYVTPETPATEPVPTEASDL